MRVPAEPGAREDCLQSAASQTWGEQKHKEKLKRDLRAREVPVLICPFLCPSPVLSTASNRCGKSPWAVSWLGNLKSGEGVAARGQCAESQRAAAGKPRGVPHNLDPGVGVPTWGTITRWCCRGVGGETTERWGGEGPFPGSKGARGTRVPKDRHVGGALPNQPGALGGSGESSCKHVCVAGDKVLLAVGVWGGRFKASWSCSKGAESCTMTCPLGTLWEPSGFLGDGREDL